MKTKEVCVKNFAHIKNKELCVKKKCEQGK